MAYYLRLLGSPAIDSAKGPVTGPATQRHRLALLAILAMAQDHTESRERLLFYLWPDTAADRGRQLLSQSLYALRKSLGEAALVSSGDRVRLNTDLVATDVGAFRDSLECEDLERAVDVYAGPFLDGFSLKGASEFEHWADTERTRFAWRYAEVLEKLAEAAEARGDLSAAVRWWRELAEHDEASSRIALRLMRSLAARGDVAAALEHAEHHARFLNVEFDTQPTAVFSEFVDRLRAGEASLSALPIADTPVPPKETVRIREPRLPPATGRRPTRRRPTPRRPALLVAGLLASVVVVTVLVAHFIDARRAAAGSSVDPNLVAIFPFRTESADSDLAYLSEGLVDLLSVVFDGEMIPRAVDPYLSVRRWRRTGEQVGGYPTRQELRRLARSMGAGRFVDGSVVGRPEGLLILATIASVEDMRSSIGVRVAGPEDSLAVLVDRLAAALLASEAGPDDLKTTLSYAAPSAVRAFLAGQAAFRQGRYQSAQQHFVRAIHADSTLAVAGLGLESARAWGLEREPAGYEEAIDQAWRSRGYLSRRDSLFLVARLGPLFPQQSPLQEMADAWAKALDADPTRAGSWYEYGDLIYHRGALLGWSPERVLETADTAFRRAVTFDSTFAAPLGHLVEIAVFEGRREEALEVAPLYERIDTAGLTRDFYRWLAANASGDSSTLGEIDRDLEAMSTPSLYRIMGTSHLYGLVLADPERIASRLVERAVTPAERRLALRALHNVYLNSGRPWAAAGVLASLRQVDEPLADRMAIFDALYWDGQVDVARAAAGRLAKRSAPPRGSGKSERADGYHDRCALAQWSLAQERRAAVESAMAYLDGASEEYDWVFAVTRARLCHRLLKATLAVEEEDPEAFALVLDTDSLLATGPLGLSAGGASPDYSFGYANLLMARLWERLDQPERALAAARRRPFLWTPSALQYLSSYLRAEGRLAEAVGDRHTAVRAYRHYLALSANPEPSRAADEAEVRSRLGEVR